MKFFETIKNALFEEEYVEVKPKTKKEEQVDSSIEPEEKEQMDIKKDKPIAKKIILSRPKKERHFDTDEKVDTPIEGPSTDSYYDSLNRKENVSIDSMKSDYPSNSYENDYNIDDYYTNDDSNHYSNEPVKDDRVIYRDEKPKEKHPYGIDESNKNLVQEYGKAYEKKEDRTGFKPSPIISPIYGVLDKNYKKEDVVQKNPKVSNYSKDSLKVDNVRNKAYGTKEVEHKTETKVVEKTKPVIVKHREEEEDDGNLLVDLSKDEVKPSIKEVTMGDALEYFQDLGLEYNVDYVDASKEKATGRRVRDDYGEEPELFAIENDEMAPMRPIPKLDTKKEVIPKNKTSEIDVDNSDNLFDLIENMYQEEK